MALKTKTKTKSKAKKTSTESAADVYDVTAIVGASSYLGEFKADSFDAAFEQANGKEHFSLCHQCARDLDVGDVDFFSVSSRATGKSRSFNRSTLYESEVQRLVRRALKAALRNPEAFATAKQRAAYARARVAKSTSQG